MLEVENVSLSVLGAAVLGNISFTVQAGDILTLMGPSGSGKSALLSFIGGDLPEAFSRSGTVRLNGRDISSLPPEQRHVGRLFQDDLLFPHMTVAENLLFGLPRNANRRAEQVRDALQSVGLAGLENRPPHTLSGGQRARVALMRSLLAQPAAILLDEPFSKLDAPLRASMRKLTFETIRTRNIPALLVTHDEADAAPGGRVISISSRLGEAP